MKAFSEANWGGWNPSAAEKNLQPDTGLTGPQRRALLRMDNLMVDEVGIVRAAKAFQLEAAPGAPHSLPTFDTILAIFSTNLSTGKRRYVFEATGTVTRNSGPSNLLDLTILTGAVGVTRCAFLAILNHVFVIAGSKKYQDRGDIVYPLGLPAPAAPVVVANSNPTIDIGNLAGGQFTNWGLSPAGGTATIVNNVGGVLTLTPDTTTNVNRVAAITGGAGTTIDTTNLGGTGNDTGGDIFSFTFMVDNVALLDYVKIELFCEAPPVAQNYYWKEWDFSTIIPNFNNPYFPFNISSGIPTQVQIPRAGTNADGTPALGYEFVRVGSDTTLGWKAIKGIRLTVGVLGACTITFSNFKVTGGKLSVLTGDFSYVAVQARDTGSYLEFSPASPPTKITLANGSATITPVAVDATTGANQYWLYRLDTTTGVYLRVTSSTGAVGFLPAPFTDTRLVTDIITDAGINPLYNLQFYRTSLPNNIIQAIWFRDRVIYLTNSNFFSSFLLDPGSYDSRFTYEISGTGGNYESCLFITKSDVGTFIIATTKDFYRVTGTFSIITDPVTGAVVQDVNIYPLGVTDPAISHGFAEYQGSIIYLSATGVRVLNNATSTLLIGNLELLFRNESRYGVAPITKFSGDSQLVGCASSGKRFYWSLPQTDGATRVFILTLESDGSSSWRLWDSGVNITTMFREEDGTVLYGSTAAANNFINSIETFGAALPIHLRTQFNYGDNPLARKDAATLRILINTGGVNAAVTVSSLGLDGAVTTIIININVAILTIFEYDLAALLPSSLAFAIDIVCTTATFILDYFSIIYEERPPVVMRAKQLATNFDSPGRKRIGTFPFVVDPIDPTNVITCTVRADNTTRAQNFTGIGDVITTLFWDNDPTIDLLAYDWEIELTATKQFEFYKFMKPDIDELTPNMSGLEIQPYNNFGSAARKILGSLPFRLNSRGNDFSINVKVDGVVQSPVNFKGADYGDRIVTLHYIPPNGLGGIDWERRLISLVGMEFYEWLDPVVIEKLPLRTKYAKQPLTNFGIPNPKKISVWPFVINTLGAAVIIQVIADGTVLPPIESSATSELSTLLWQNVGDIIATDWMMEVSSQNEFEFYNFMKPDIEQVFPLPRFIHQVGPLDFNKKGIVYGARFRVMSAAKAIHYKVMDSDVEVWSNDMSIIPNRDGVYEEKFPKGIDISVCKILIMAIEIGGVVLPFTHFSTEFKVRLTGKETEEQYIMVKDG